MKRYIPSIFVISFNFDSFASRNVDGRSDLQSCDKTFRTKTLGDADFLQKRSPSYFLLTSLKIFILLNFNSNFDWNKCEFWLSEYVITYTYYFSFPSVSVIFILTILKLELILAVNFDPIIGFSLKAKKSISNLVLFNLFSPFASSS